VALETAHQDICWVEAIDVDSGDEHDAANDIALTSATRETREVIARCAYQHQAA
jgi:hypothetical protein